MMVHGGQEFRWGPVVVAGDEISHDDDRQGHQHARRDGLLRVRDRFAQPARRDRVHGYLDEHREGRVVNMEPGDPIELKVTPDRYITVRYAGASGDFNPIHIDEEFAAASACPGGSCTGCGRWRRSRARTPRRPAGPSGSSGCRSSSAGWAGWARRSIVIDGTVREVGGRDGGRRLAGRAVRPPDHPQRGRGDLSRLTEDPGQLDRRGAGSARPTINRADCTPGARAAQGRRGVPRGRRARGLKGAVGRRPVGPVDDPPRAGEPRGAGPARAPAHVRRPHSRPRPATATSSTGCCRRRPPRRGCRCRWCAASSTRRCG